MHRRVFFIFVLLLGSACSKSSDLNWNETVELNNGAKIIVARHAEFNGPYEIGDTPTLSAETMDFSSPAGVPIKWSGERDLAPVAILIQGEVVMLLLVTEFDGYSRRGCPHPPYFLFSYSPMGWQEVGIENIPVKKVAPNLTRDIKGSRSIIEAAKKNIVASQDTPPTINGRAYYLDFSKSTKQTFGVNNCNSRQEFEEKFLIKFGSKE